MALILDTGPLLAALDAADPDHARCAALLTDSAEDLVVPALVLAELDYWCARRLSPDAWLDFLDDVLAGAYRIEPPTAADLARCRDRPAKYGTLPWGWSMRVSWPWRSGSTPKLATLDQRHFRAMRPLHVAALELRP